MASFAEAVEVGQDLVVAAVEVISDRRSCTVAWDAPNLPAAFIPPPPTPPPGFQWRDSLRYPAELRSDHYYYFSSGVTRT